MCGGVGTDIVSVPRITALFEGRGTPFLERWFTATELAYCLSKARPGLHLAARLAAKEAVVKALALTWSGPLPWRYVEIVNDRRGAPAVRLSGAVAQRAADAGVQGIAVSLAHCDEYATATAVLSRGERTPLGASGRVS